jgi:aminoglycoside phosphotransferase (APT) family kinase protein
VTVDLVSALIDEQFPEWSGRPIRFAADGRDNAVYRLGDDLAVRLPRRQRAADRVPERFRAGLLLPPDLPLAVSRAVALGAPGCGYEWRWTIDRWVDGTPAVGLVELDRASMDSAALDLAAFVRALAAAGLVHGDLHPANLLIRAGSLVGVIDFDQLGAGDPAHDLMVAWTFLPRRVRPVFRAASGVDDATWERGRDWAERFGRMCTEEFPASSVIGEMGRRTLVELAADAR